MVAFRSQHNSADPGIIQQQFATTRYPETVEKLTPREGVTPGWHEESPTSYHNASGLTSCRRRDRLHCSISYTRHQQSIDSSFDTCTPFPCVNGSMRTKKYSTLCARPRPARVRWPGCLVGARVPAAATDRHRAIPHSLAAPCATSAASATTADTAASGADPATSGATAATTEFD